MLPLAPAAGTMQRTVVACSSARMVYVLLQRAPAVSPLCSKSGRKLQQQRPLCTEAPPSGEGAAKGTATAKGKVKDVMVVGAGVAGLASAACLSRIGVRVTVVAPAPPALCRASSRKQEGGPPLWQSPVGRDEEKEAAAGQKQKEQQEPRKKGVFSSPAGGGTPRVGRRSGVSGAAGGALDPGVGIWTHGLACLDQLGVLPQLEAEGRYMGQAGYRDTAGNWLATPSTPLEEFKHANNNYATVTDDERESLGGGSETGEGVVSGGGGDGERGGDGSGGAGGGGGGGGGASVLFVRESKLMEALRSALPDDVTFIDAQLEDVAFGEDPPDGGNDRTGVVGGPREGFASGAGRGGARTDGGAADSNGGDSRGWRAHFDLLVGADGSDSSVRDRVVLMSLESETAAVGEGSTLRKGGGGAPPPEKGERRELSDPAKLMEAREGIELASPQRRGYTVFRGVVCSSEDPSSADGPASAVDRDGQDGEGDDGAEWGLQSFQTWGPGLRFASVPLAGNERMWFATVVDELLHGDSDAGGNPSETPSHDDETKHFLLDKFGDWHTPVASLLRSTKPGTIGREDARAMSRRGLRAVADAGAASRRRQRSREKAQSGGFGDGTDGDPVVLVGDAAHTLDPVLAQGAGVALEDAFFLAQTIKEFNDNRGRVNDTPAAEASVGRTAREAGDAKGLQEMLSRYDSERLQRAILLSGLSDLSQSLGQLRKPGWLVKARDSALARFLIPASLRSRVFDSLMSASLGGSPAGACRAAAAAAGVRVAREKHKWRFGGYRVPKL